MFTAQSGSRPNSKRPLAGTIITVLTTLLASLSILAAVAPVASAAATTPTTYRDFVYPTGTGLDGPSADKPQSKLWYTDGTWWALMVPASGGGVYIHKLDRATHTWVSTGAAVDDRIDSTGDALWDGSKLYTISRTSSGDIRVNRLSHPSGGGWSRDSGFPVTVGTGGTETATLDKDSTGVLWATWTQSNKVIVTHSTANGQNVFTPAGTLPVPDPTVYSDDIAAVLAYRGKVGILWSDHTTGSSESTATSYMRFAEHTDGTGDSANDWTVQNVTTGVYSSDDHINLKSWSNDPSGRIYAAIKTSNSDNPNAPSTAPSIIVAARTTGGSWTLKTAGTKADGLTRPQLAIDSSTSQLHVLMTAPEAGGTIYDKTSSLSSLSFTTGKGTPFVTWSGAKINNVSVSKDPVTSTSGLVALATDKATQTYYHAELGGSSGGGTADTTAPSTPSGFGTDVTGSSVKLTWTASSDDVGVTGYVLTRDNVALTTVTGTSYTDDGVSAGSHTYTVKAKDAAGNLSAAASATASVTATPPPSGSSPAHRATERVAATAAATIALPRPAGTQTGDLLLAAISSRGNPTLTAPAGWTLVRTDAVSTTERQSVWSRVAAADDPSSWTFNLGRAQSAVVGQVAAYSGASGVVASGANSAASGQVLTAPAVAGSTTSVVFFSETRNTTLTAQAPLTGRGQLVASGTSTVTASSADATGANGPYTANATASSTWIAQTIALSS